MILNTSIQTTENTESTEKYRGFEIMAFTHWVSVPLIPTHCFFSVCSVPSVVNCFF
jgi:hypothetical protein